MRIPVLLLLFTIAGCNYSKGQWQLDNGTSGDNPTPFYKINTEKLEDFDGLQELGKFTDAPRVYMSGENHKHMAVNGLLEFKLLCFLHEKAGVRNLLLELGEARGWYANRYVNEIDTQEKYCLQATTSLEHMKILDDIRAWNLSLPAEQRIQIHGIDVERFNSIAILRLSDILPKTGVPEKLYTAVHAVHQAAGWLSYTGLKEYDASINKKNYNEGTPPFSIEESIEKFVAHFDSLDNELKNWLGYQYTEVQSGINSLREYRQWNQYRNSAFHYTWREEIMYRKLTALLNRDTSARFYGQFGRCHSVYVKQDGDCGWYAYQSVMNRLQERYFKSNHGTLSIGVFYEDEMGNNMYRKENNIEDKRMQNEIYALLRRAPAGAVSITKLDNGQNPLLAARFGFFMAVRQSHTSIQKSAKPEKAFALSFGLNFLTLNDAPKIAYHINPAWQGKVVSEQPICFGINWHNEHFTVRAQTGSSLSTEYYSKEDELSIRYLFQYSGVYTGWRFLKSQKLSMDLGPHLYLASQIIKCNRLNGGFLKPDPDYEKKVNNRALSTGFQVRLQCKLNSFMQAGFAAGYLYDISEPDWFIEKSNLYYARNQLQTQVTGRSLAVFVNFDL